MKTFESFNTDQNIENILNIIGDEGFPFDQWDRSDKISGNDMSNKYQYWCVNRAFFDEKEIFGELSVFINRLLEVIERLKSEYNIKLKVEHLIPTDEEFSLVPSKKNMSKRKMSEWHLRPHYIEESWINIPRDAKHYPLLKQKLSKMNIECVFLKIEI